MTAGTTIQQLYSSQYSDWSRPLDISTTKQAVDALQVTAGANYNRAVNALSQLSSLRAGYAIDVASKLDVDFAGETTELAKGQILAQAGTAMLGTGQRAGSGHARINPVVGLLI